MDLPAKGPGLPVRMARYSHHTTSKHNSHQSKGDLQWIAPLSRISGFPLGKGRQICTIVEWIRLLVRHAGKLERDSARKERRRERELGRDGGWRADGVSGKSCLGKGVSYLITNERLVNDTVPPPPPVPGLATAEAARTATKSAHIEICKLQQHE